MNKKYFHPSRFLTVALLAAVFLVLSGASGAWAETYTSEDSSYPERFYNSGSQHNDLQYLDAVYFGGREVIFHTLLHTESDHEEDIDRTDSEYLYFYTPGYDFYGKLNINNSLDRNFRFTTCAFDETLYIFYTEDESLNSGKIYYRTATVLVGDDIDDWGLNNDQVEEQGKDYRLVFSEEFVYPVVWPSSVKILSAEVMNGVLYFCCESNNTIFINQWNGNAWAKSIGQGIYGCDAAVFQVPDVENGQRDVMMLAHCPETGGIHYFFFDGGKTYGDNSIAADGLSPRSVCLVPGSAEGYNSEKYAIQAFLAYPDNDGSDKSWSRIYHREYVPSGQNGEQGTWSSSWSYLSNDSKDHIHCYRDYESDMRWRVTPSFSDENSDIRMSVNIWYARGTDYQMFHGYLADLVQFRCSSYKSDLLKYETTITKKPEDWGSDYSAALVFAIIEGTPPFPMNNGKLGDGTTNTSVLSLGTTENTNVSFNYSVGGSVTFSIGRSAPPKDATSSQQMKLTQGVKYTHNTTTSTSVTVSKTYKTYLDSPPGDLGWALVLMPEVITDQYLLTSYNGSSLIYSDDTSGAEYRMYLIQYGDKSQLVEIPYYLDNPTQVIGGTGTNSFFEGMAKRPLSSNLMGDPDNEDDNGWVGVSDEYKYPDWPPSFSYVELPLEKDIYNAVGVTTAVSVSTGTTTTDIENYNGSFTVSAVRLGIIGVETNFNYSMDWSTSTSITNNMQFMLNIPECCNPLYQDCPDPNSCVNALYVMPILLKPNDDDSGYNAPWISDDVRNNKKGKPWCLSYLVTPVTSTTAVDPERLAITNASANLYLDRRKPNHDEISAEITLGNLPEDFSLRNLSLLQCSFHNYVVHSDENPVTNYSLKENKIVLKLEEPGNPNASIRLTLKHKPAKTLVNITVDAHGIDLSELAAYLTSGGKFGGAPETVPFNFAIGDKYVARDNLPAEIRMDEKKIRCRLRAVE